MLSETQRRLLLRLADFGVEVESAWDAPRALSLPGLAEHLGLVRSAIHNPLKELESSGLISTRLAHVIGGGPRRRTVVHLTDTGRQRAELLSEEQIPEKSESLAVGPIPNHIQIQGRDDELESLLTKILAGENVQLTGLPGIGKTSLSRSLAELLMERGFKIRWATCNSDTDAFAIGSMWLGKQSPRDPVAIASAASGNKTALFLDEVQELHPRHLSSVKSLLSACSETSTGVLASIRAPSPFGKLSNFEEIRIHGLDTPDAVELLPKSIGNESAKQVAEALGGHPLALHLWSPDEEIPEEGQAVQDFVQRTVLRRLTDEGLGTLDELSLSPLPLSVEELSVADGIAELDDSAVLRWMQSLVEPHHLIRNVRRATVDEKIARELHTKAAGIWSKREGNRARRIEAHHRLNSGDELDTEWLVESVAKISLEDSAAAAVLIDDAIQINDEDNLRLTAIDLAFERGEPNIASEHIDSVSESPQKLIRKARLARQQGDLQEAENLLQSAFELLPPAEVVRAKIASLVRAHDDMLPGQQTKVRSSQIEEIDLSRLPNADIASASLALDLLRHAVAVESGSVETLANVRSSLVAQMGENHPRLALIDLRTLITSKAEGSLEAAKEYIESEADQIDKIIAIHLALEATSPSHPDWLVTAHNNAIGIELRPEIPSHRRLLAQRWYWRGVLEPNMRLSHWREAISRFKSAECPSAASELLLRLTRSL